MGSTFYKFINLKKKGVLTTNTEHPFIQSYKS